MQKYFIVYNHDEASKRISRVPLSIDPFKYASKKTVQRERKRLQETTTLFYLLQPSNQCLQCAAVLLYFFSFLVFIPLCYFVFLFLSFFRPFTMLNHSAGWLYAQPSSFISLCVTFCYTLVPWPPTKSNGRSELEGQEEGNNKKYISVDSALFVFLFLSQIAIHAKQRTGFSFVFVC